MSVPRYGETDRSHFRWTSQFTVAVGLVMSFGILVVWMLSISGDAELQWQRRLYIFGAVQATVFTAVGWLFGREVSRSDAESAQENLRQSRTETSEARRDAKLASTALEEARIAVSRQQEKARAVLAASRSLASASATRSSGPRDVSVDATDEPGALPSEFVQFLEELYRDD